MIDEMAMARAAYNAGFRDDALRTFLAIEFAESDGNTDATVDTRGRTDLPPGISPEYSVGPAQINLLVHDDITEAQARTYAGAAEYCWVLSQWGTDFNPWSTYTGGAYQSQLARVDALIANGIIIAYQRSVTVQSGDTLSGIAEEVYGDASRWPEIYNANKEVIGDNPDVIQPGMSLIIPTEHDA